MLHPEQLCRDCRLESVFPPVNAREYAIRMTSLIMRGLVHISEGAADMSEAQTSALKQCIAEQREHMCPVISHISHKSS